MRLTYVLIFTVHTMKNCQSCQQEKNATEHDEVERMSDGMTLKLH